jgi:hypothetical protein
MLRGPAASKYLGLYRAGRRARLDYPESWVAIDLRSAEPTPWTDGAREFMFSPQAKALERGGALYELPDWLSSDVAAAQPLREEPNRPGATIGLSLLAALTLSSLTPILRKKRGSGAV